MKRVALVILALLALLVGGAMAWSLRHETLDPLGPDRVSPDEAAATRGERLAAAGGCASCHGDDLAGGLAIETPFGTIHATNITPDPVTGIGTWSEEAFRRAMRKGVDREGRYLYPAFPYDSFTNLTDADIADIFAFLRARPAVSREPRSNELAFPYTIRWLLAGWTALFLEEGPWLPDPERDDTWNRGAYLAEGLGHCSACHSPRNRFGARVSARAYSGSFAEGWWSPALNEHSAAPMRWTEEELLNYLLDGWEENHGIAAGPMKDVVENVSRLPESDVEAIAVYIASLDGEAEATNRDAARAVAETAALSASDIASLSADPALEPGAKLFVSKCANCHRADAESVPLALATAVNGPYPQNFMRIVVEGVTPTENAFFVRAMPGTKDLSPEDLGALAAFVRNRYSDGPAWVDLEKVAADILAGEVR